MTYEVSSRNSNVFYINFKERGNGEKYAHSTLEFKYPILSNVDNYVCSVDRFRIPLNTIPFNDVLIGAVSLLNVNTAPPTGDIFPVDQSFSIFGFFTELNNIDAGLKFIITDDGRCKITYNNFQNKYIVLSQELADILNFPTTIGDTTGLTPNNSSFTSSAVILDKCDQLEDIRLEVTGLPVSSEYLSATVEGFVLSDFLASGGYDISKTGSNTNIFTGDHTLSSTPRQDLILEPNLRRFIYINGSQPVYKIVIKAFAIFRDGSKNEIILPPRSVFSVKLSFYRKY